MKRYKVRLLHYKDHKSFVIYLSANSILYACRKANEFVRNAYGFGVYYISSVYQDQL